MSIIRENIKGKEILVEIRSSNLRSAKYNTETKILEITFNNGNIYEYYEFPQEQFVKFRMTESQGKFLNAHINGKYKYKRVIT